MIIKNKNNFIILNYHYNICHIKKPVVFLIYGIINEHDD